MTDQNNVNFAFYVLYVLGYMCTVATVLHGVT